MNQPATNIHDLKQRAKLPAKQAGGKAVSEFFEQNKPAIQAVLPKHISPDRMLKVALHAVRAVPQLMECTTESLFGAVVQCSQLGLEPNTVLGHAYLLPFRNKRANRTDVQMIIGYKGLIDLARRSGQIISIAAHAVHEFDEFEFNYGLIEDLMHKPKLGERGRIIAFYAVAHLQGGGHAFEIMSVDEINQIKLKSQSRGEWGPWKDHYTEMGRKTVIRRLSKYLPLSIEFSTATALDSTNDSGQPQDLSGVLSGEFSVMDESYTQPQEQPDATQETLPAAETQTAQSVQQWPQSFTDPETGDTGWTDSAGEFFDPAWHSMGADGVPAVKRDGSFRAKRGVGKRTTAQEQTEQSQNSDQHEDMPDTEQLEDLPDAPTPYAE